MRWNTLNPVWEEEFELMHLPRGSALRLEVWDKDKVRALPGRYPGCWSGRGERGVPCRRGGAAPRRRGAAAAWRARRQRAHAGAGR